MEINEDGKLGQGEGVQGNSFDYSLSSFKVNLPNGTYINVNPEYISHTSGGLTQSGRYHVLYVDLQYGTSTFYVQQEHGFHWTSHHYPPFVSLEFIVWVGQQINFKNL